MNGLVQTANLLWVFAILIAVHTIVQKPTMVCVPTDHFGYQPGFDRSGGP